MSDIYLHCSVGMTFVISKARAIGRAQKSSGATHSLPFRPKVEPSETIPTMTSSPDSIVASLLAQHNAEQTALDAQKAAEPKVTVTFSPNPLPRVKAKKVTAPIHHGSNIPSMTNMPERGSLDAAAFMAAVRSAGQRINDGGFPYTAPLEVRGDLIRAIHGYVGYDSRGDFGSQETAARGKAMRDLKIRKVTAGPEVLRNASKSLDGFVAGLPDHRAKALSNLLAQREVVVEAIATYTAAGADDKAALEAERLSHLRIQITAMGFND